MALDIVSRSLGNVKILECSGKIVLGQEGGKFRDALRAVLDLDCRKVIVKFGDILYIDSSGLQAVVGGFMSVVSKGGQIVMVLPKERVKLRDLFKLTKVYTILDIFEDEASALQYFESRHHHCICPVCGHRSSPPKMAQVFLPQTCRNLNCRLEFRISPVAGNPAVVSVESAKMPTIGNEYFEVVMGKPITILILGRLDLLTSSLLIKLCKRLPSQIALLDLRAATEVSPKGVDAVLDLISAIGNEGRLSVSLEGLAPEHTRLFPVGPPVYLETAKARAPRRSGAEGPSMVYPA